MYCPVKDSECVECFAGLSSQPGLGFAAYPFTHHYKDFMERLAEELESQGIELYLPHRDFQPSIIFCKLVPKIWESQFVISDVSEINQNVLFEHGYAMGMKRPTVFIRKRDATSKLPGFLRDIERIEYNYRSDITSGLTSFLQGTALKSQDELFTRGLTRSSLAYRGNRGGTGSCLPAGGWSSARCNTRAA